MKILVYLDSTRLRYVSKKKSIWVYCNFVVEWL